MAAGANADFLRDRELAQWLEHRLDSSDDLWTASRNLSAVITKELLANIPSCFVDLQTHAKLKILMSVLYFPKRNVEQWRDEIEDMLSLACQDTDEWVQTVAELLKEYPTTSGISFNMDNDGSQFTKTMQEIRKILRRQVKGPCSQVLPLDSAYMNKQAAQSTWGIQVQQPSAASARYFSLKRKPKAAAQRVDFLQKSADAATQMKYKSNGSLSSILPIRHKSTVRKMDDQTPLKGIPTHNPAKTTSSGFRPGTKPINRQVSISSSSMPRNRPMVNGSGGGSGVKLIDISDTPQALEKKRKTMEAEEKAAKKAAKEEQKRQREEEKTQKKLQRDLKVQRSLQQNESRVSESSTGGSTEGTQNNGVEEAKLHTFNADSLVHPTPDYAAELFEGVGPLSRVNASNLPVRPAATVEPTSSPAFTPATAGISSLVSSSVESQTAAAALSQPLPMASSVAIPDAIANAVTTSTPFFFTPTTPAAVKAVATALPSAVSINEATPSTEKPERPKAASRKGATAKSTPKTTNVGAAKPNSRSKKRKADAPAEAASDQLSPAQQQRPPVLVSVGQSPAGISVQPMVQQTQQPPQVVRFQYGGMTTTAAAPLAQPIAGRGLAQMAQNVFISQQPVPQNQQQIAFMPQVVQQQQQPQQGQQQMTGPRTILFVQQTAPGVVSNQGPATVSFYNPAPGASSVLVRQPQPAQSTLVPTQMLASFTPSVIRQASSEVNATTGASASAQMAANAASALRPIVPPPTQQLVLQQSAGTSDGGDSKKPTFTITKEVMLKAQEMFRTANKLSRPEKALILGFMAGNRENPCPQMGQVLTVRLSENQDAQTQADGSTRPVMIETYFQMNYDTGEWKQIRKIRQLREDEGQIA